MAERQHLVATSPAAEESCPFLVLGQEGIAARMAALVLALNFLVTAMKITEGHLSEEQLPWVTAQAAAPLNVGDAA
jgi:hypothetical protein